MDETPRFAPCPARCVNGVTITRGIIRDCWRCAGWGWILHTDDTEPAHTDEDDEPGTIPAVMHRWAAQRHAAPDPTPSYDDPRMYSPTMRYLGAMQSWNRRATRWS